MELGFALVLALAHASVTVFASGPASGPASALVFASALVSASAPVFVSELAGVYA